ncbi:cation:proton antiporter [Halostella sp. JP-L12]|uniref:MnhB domain-containing protein n=1 Tax=Halostella TaxID=1843185 RepID=UPI000EF79C62|nr:MULTISPECIES: MnhB domain-containing protein [Halostella]NHN47392.1 cation:proton antiporter [Halostella sp. JP-L12]
MSSRDIPYVESTIIMTTVRVVAPFVLTLGLFIMFHGAGSAGGGFQGGVVVGTVILMLAFAFGIDAVREWLDPTAILGVIALGLFTFLGVGFGALALGGAFLEYHAFEPLGIYHVVGYAIELVELGIGAIVTGVIVGLFFVIAAGFDVEDGEEEDLL